VTPERVDLTGGCLVFRTLEKRRQGVYTGPFPSPRRPFDLIVHRVQGGPEHRRRVRDNLPRAGRRLVRGGRRRRLYRRCGRCRADPAHLPGRSATRAEARLTGAAPRASANSEAPRLLPAGGALGSEPLQGAGRVLPTGAEPDEYSAAVRLRSASAGACWATRRGGFAAGEGRRGRRGQAQGVVQLAVGERAARQRDLLRQILGFTRRVRHPTPIRLQLCP
jgi:hypothetical protein